MKPLKPIVATLAAGLLLAAAPAAHAQMSPDLIMENYNSNIQVITNGIINKDMMNKTVARYNARGGSRGTAASAAAARPAAVRTSFGYVPTAALQQQTVNAYVAGIRAINPAGATTVAEGLNGKTPYPALYRELNSGMGLHENDAADVMALYLLENWVVANGITDAKVITPARTQAVRAQAAKILGSNPKLQSAAALAQFGEQLKINAAMLEVGRLRAQHDGTSATYSQKIASQLRNQFHLDMSQLQLTSQGLVKK